MRCDGDFTNVGSIAFVVDDVDDVAVDALELTVIDDGVVDVAVAVAVDGCTRFTIALVRRIRLPTSRAVGRFDGDLDVMSSNNRNNGFNNDED